jgi:NAD(P)H-dependent FMN reductase
LIIAAIELSKESIVGMEIEHLDISQLPMQNIDLEGEDHEGSFPPAVEDFRQKILESDCILFSSPEFNYSVSGIILLH